MNEFYYPRKYKWFSIVAILFFGALSIISFVTSIMDYENISDVAVFIPSSLFFLIFVYMGYEFLCRCNDIITLDDSGIHIFYKNDSKQTINWNDIYEVRERSQLQRIDLLNRFGDTLLKIDYQLAGFDMLCETILSKSRYTQNVKQKRAFISSWLIRGIFIVSAIFSGCAIVGSYTSGQFNAMCGFTGFLLLCGFGYLWEVKRIRVDENEISIHSFFKKRTIKYTDISDVVLKSDKDGKGNLISTVYLVLDHDKPVKFAGVQGGSLALYESIKSAWQKNRKV